MQAEHDAKYRKRRGDDDECQLADERFRSAQARDDGQRMECTVEREGVHRSQRAPAAGRGKHHGETAQYGEMPPIEQLLASYTHDRFPDPISGTIP